ncbi:MAG: transcriptional regulator [Candidatus Omnitrophica bacterium CG11_big_fil_rev_8_21_14_0_20_43_6]|nr:MAG: transcriptional regulator [Candidatus Omnitrophica bacterium CG11_big_fil_rev_8_21_14_0_20_43_6]
MRVTYKGDYALKALLDLAIHYEHGLLTIHDIAKHISAPVKFLEQVLLELKNGGFVESRRGKIGGYLLARAPGRITLGEAVRFIDGPIEPIACVEKGYTGCTDIYKCVFRKIWLDMGRSASEIVDHITFEELANKVQVNTGALVYQI